MALAIFGSMLITQESQPAHALVSSAVDEFQPAIPLDNDGYVGYRGGRMVAVDVHPQDAHIAIAASESGGLFKTADGGATWRHIDTLPVFRMADVGFSPITPNVVIATSLEDSRVAGGSIWRSIDGGETWALTPDQPTCNNGQVSSWGIAFGRETNVEGVSAGTVYVGTDCGLAVGTRSGERFIHVDPNPDSTDDRIAAIAVTSRFLSAKPSGTDVVQLREIVLRTSDVVDVCGPSGHHRSENPDVASTWSSSRLGDSCGITATHSVATSPYEDVVLIVTTGAVYESSDGGASWTRLPAFPGVGRSRLPTIATRSSRSGDLDRFDVYASNPDVLFRGTCRVGGMTPRCQSLVWSQLDVAHADPSDIAFFPQSPCPKFIADDGGIEVSTDTNSVNCGTQWKMIGGGPGGLNALQIYQVAGQVVSDPSHVDLYFGTQDNGVWASPDGGQTWPVGHLQEGGNISVLHSMPNHDNTRVTWWLYNSGNIQSDPAHLNPDGGLWNNVTNSVGTPSVVDAGVHVQLSNPPRSCCQLNLTTDTGATWPTSTPLAMSVVNSFTELMVAGPRTDPTVYYPARQSAGGSRTIARFSGIRTSTPTAAFINAGLGFAFDVGQWRMGQGSFRAPFAFGVDSNDPDRMYAANLFPSSSNGSMTTWNTAQGRFIPDTELTARVTADGQLLFSYGNRFFGSPQSQAHAIAFDPSNSNRILVGTEAAGIIASLDGGRTWGVVPGSQRIPAIGSFFFASPISDDIFVGSYGRGLWKTRIPRSDLEILQVASTEEPLSGGLVTFTISVRNKRNEPVADATILDTAPSEWTFVPQSSTPGCRTDRDPPGEQAIRCRIGDIEPLGSKTIQLTFRDDRRSPACTTFTNTAYVGAVADEVYPADNTSTAWIRIASLLEGCAPAILEVAHGVGLLDDGRFASLPSAELWGVGRGIGIVGGPGGVPPRIFSIDCSEVRIHPSEPGQTGTSEFFASGVDALDGALWLVRVHDRGVAGGDLVGFEKRSGLPSTTHCGADGVSTTGLLAGDFSVRRQPPIVIAG